VPTWRKPQSVPVPPELTAAVGSAALAELLYRRGFTTPQAAESFLTGGIDVDAPGLPDLDAGVHCVVTTLLAGQRICVYGDYDTDGVTATTLLVSLLRSVGADVTYYIPNRFRDGYGMNSRAVEALAQEGVSLLLTCDCGIRNVEEVALARKLGLNVVVTDHHELGPELPVAEAVINPKRLPEEHPCRMLPGVGTGYLFARQLLRALDRDPADADQWLDLVAVGIIADVVPLNGANRELARRGLTRLYTSPCAGLFALAATAGLTGAPTEEDVAFQLVPRLNAAGRLADAMLAVKLLLAEDPVVAEELALQLDQLNQERKRLTASVAESASAEASDRAGAIVLYRPEWHEGVLGIAAGKLSEQYGLPTLLMARKHGTNVLVGSARSPEGFSLHEALAACGDLLLKHGGHAGAAGFSLLEDQFPAFRAAMLEEARRRVVPKAQATTEADLAIPLAAVDRRLYDDMRRMAPFGEANSAPVLHSTRVKLLSSRPIGAGERHLRLVVRDGEQSFTGLWWGAGSLVLEPGEVDLYYRLGLNRWNGEELLQVLVEHLQRAEASGDTPSDSAPAFALRPQVARPVLADRRGVAPLTLTAEFPNAVLFAEAGRNPGAVDRYSLRPAGTLVMQTPVPSPQILDEVVARTGAARLVLAWPTEPPPDADRFLPGLMQTLAGALATSPYVSIPLLAVRTGELEAVIRLALDALAESDLLAIDEDEGETVRLRRRADGRGVKDSPSLERMRRLLAESRAFRRFLRKAPLPAIDKAIYSPHLS